MTIPSSFVRSLEAQFNGMLRIRWSPSRNAFQIEQRHAKATIGPVDPRDDEAIRRRDGYYLVMDVAPGDRQPCPRCRTETSLPIRKLGEAKCPQCAFTWRASYWPLGESLLEQLRWSDPFRGGVERVFERTDRDMAGVVAAKRRSLRNSTEAIWKDDFNHVFDIPQVGYTGRDFRSAQWNR